MCPLPIIKARITPITLLTFDNPSLMRCKKKRRKKKQGNRWKRDNQICDFHSSQGIAKM
jgi:hypothetical protein